MHLRLLLGGVEVEVHLIARLTGDLATCREMLTCLPPRTRNAPPPTGPGVGPSALLQNVVISSRSAQLMTVLPSRIVTGANLTQSTSVPRGAGGAPADLRRLADTFGRMGAKRYVALLRGINVGGRNRVAMADLNERSRTAAMEQCAPTFSPATWCSSPPLRKSLENDIQRVLETRFSVPLVVVVRSHDQLHKVVDQAPDGFGADPDTYHSDVIFLKSPLTAHQAMRVVVLCEGVDQAWPSAGVLYFVGVRQRTKSRMSSIVGTPEYQLMTIRSWTTTTKLLALLDEGIDS